MLLRARVIKYCTGIITAAFMPLPFGGIMEIVVIDGQGGRMGRLVIEQLKREHPAQFITAIGTNSIATSTMVKAGADVGATGENPAIVACRKADIIIGPIGIVIADALLGEVTPQMAVAIGQCSAEKLLIPINRCNVRIAGMGSYNMSDFIKQGVDYISAKIRGQA